MDAQTFNAFLEGKLNDIRDILASKGAEYVPEGKVEKSRFHNFEISAALNGSTKEQALWGFVTKHIVSLADMIKDDATDHSMAKWDEKIGDISVYMLLLHAMVYEAHDNADMVKVAMKEYADHVSSLEDVSIKSDDIPPEDPPTDVGANFYPSGLELIADIEEQEVKQRARGLSTLIDTALHTEPVNRHTSAGLIPNDHVATLEEPYPPETKSSTIDLRVTPGGSKKEAGEKALEELRRQENKTPDDTPRIEKVDGAQDNTVVVSDPSGLSEADKQHRAWMARVTPPQHS